MLVHPASLTKATGASHPGTTGRAANEATSRGSQGKSEVHEKSHESRRVETGHDWLDNNGVNVLMAATMSVGAMGIAQYVWGLNVFELFV